MEHAGKAKRPHWLPDLAGFYVRRKLLGERVPLFASFKLTYACNLACLACPFHRLAGAKAGLSWDGAVRALEGLKRLGTRIVVFEGGEPFLWQAGSRGLAELVEYAKGLFLRVAVTTNGTFPLEAPADVIWVSVDGTARTHDVLRSGSFSRVWENLEAAGRRQTGPRILVHFTMNRLNWRELGPLADGLRDLPAVKGITVQLYYPYDGGDSALALAGEERRQALCEAIRLKGRHPIINSAACLRRMMDNDWRCREDLLVNVDPDGRITQGCYARRRGRVECRSCGFTPVAEASAALGLRPGSLLAGWRAYLA